MVTISFTENPLDVLNEAFHILKTEGVHIFPIIHNNLILLQLPLISEVLKHGEGSSS